MNKRVNITLPEQTLRLIDRVAQKGDRSRFIDRAIKHYVGTVGRENLREQIKQGAIGEAELDLAVTEDWFLLEEEAWERRANELP